MKQLQARHLLWLLCVTACTTTPEPVPEPVPTVACRSCQATITRVHADISAATAIEQQIERQQRCESCRASLTFYEQDGMLMVASTAVARPMPCGRIAPPTAPAR